MRVLQLTDRVFFVESSQQAVSTLFSSPVPGTTAAGTFKVQKNGIAFFDLKGHKRAFLAATQHTEPFIVSCGKVLMKNGKSRTTYMQALCSLDELWLDLRDWSWSELASLARRLWAEVKPA